MLSLLAASFIYINTTAINTDQILALEAAPDNKSCFVHLLSKNPFPVQQTCVELQKKVEFAISRTKPKDNTTTNILLSSLIGLLLGGVIGVLAGRNIRTTA